MFHHVVKRIFLFVGEKLNGKLIFAEFEKRFDKIVSTENARVELAQRTVFFNEVMCGPFAADTEVYRKSVRALNACAERACFTVVKVIFEGFFCAVFRFV